MRRLGTIVRIQIQVDRLKAGEESRRVYDPSGIRAVDSVWVGGDGLVAPMDQGYVLDVHHRAHPHSRNREGRNALSLGFAGHYEVLRARFGDRLGSVIPAPPCAPFADWALGSPEGGADPRARKVALAALSEGMRGFYARVEGAELIRVTLGDEAWALG